MKWSWFGRAAMALVSALGLGLGMTACGGHTVAYMWVIGQQYNQITGFKVDNDTGNLTAIQNSPFAANGSKPVYLVVKPSGGRYLYVVNQGATTTPTQNSDDSGIAVFAVGGDGALTYQQSYPTQGFVHLWAQFDSTGNYLYVLDKYAPTGTGGAITAFLVDPNTGRLTLQTQTAATPSGGVSPNFVPVGENPINMASSGGCLFTLNGGDAANNVAPTVTPYVSSSGQLIAPTNGTLPLTAVAPTNINGNASYMIITDAGPSNATGLTTSGAIFPYTVGGTCNLTTFTGGGQGVANTPNGISSLTNATNPTYSLLDTSGRYLFILNSSNASTNPDNPYSQISAYDIVTTPVSQLSAVPGEPFVVGSMPVCIVEDPLQRYMYVSNRGGTITGFDFTSTQGTLEDLSRGSSFTINDNQLGCLALSGSVD